MDSNLTVGMFAHSINKTQIQKIPVAVALIFSCCSFCLIPVGCGTTSKQSATEQLLVSDAIDQAVSQVDFRHLTGRKVYLDTVHLRHVKSVGFVNADYIISSIRQQLTAARCSIMDNKADAEVVVEPRVGALGTDGHDITFGLPQSNNINAAISAIGNGVPLPTIPEVSVGRSNAQSGIAKLIVFAYDKESRQPVWQSGIAQAESTSRNTWLFGAGPFQRGSIYEGVRFAGTELGIANYGAEDPANNLVDYRSQHTFPAYGQLRPRFAEKEDESEKK